MKVLSKATVRTHGEPWHQEISVGAHRLVADEGVDGGGRDDGPAPYDYVLAGLGACTAITLQMYAKHKGFAVDGLEVTLSLAKDEVGHVHVQRVLKMDSLLTDAQRQRLLEIAAKTPVTKTLLAGMAIDTCY